VELTTSEIIAFNELKDRISTWFGGRTAAYNKNHLTSPPNEFVVHAEIVLNDVGRVVREPSLSSSKLLELLSKDYAFIVSVRIEPEVERIVILINREEHAVPAT
jgi:hypothetical protein